MATTLDDARDTRTDLIRLGGAWIAAVVDRADTLDSRAQRATILALGGAIEDLRAAGVAQ